MQYLEQTSIPNKPEYIVDDVTTEKLAVLMAANNGKMAMISTEGGIFDILAGRYSKDGVGNIDLYLKAHSGDPISYHRMNRESVEIPEPALTMCLGVQPGVIEDIGSNKRFRNRGLLARILYTYCKPRAGYRDRLKYPLSEEIRALYQEYILNLLTFEPDTPLILGLSDEAQAEWNRFYLHVEKEMRGGGSLQHLKDWGSKLAGQVARIAGLFHYAVYMNEAGDTPISVNFVNSSCEIGKYYMEQSRAVFNLMQEPESIKAAKKILDYLKREKPETFKGRDVLKHTGFDRMEEINPGLNVLVERGYIKPIERKDTTGRGRPEATIYRVNPKILA